MKRIPNYLSISRMILCLSLFFLKPMSICFYFIYILCGLSDIMDEFIARKMGSTSVLGAKLDSLADFIMVGVLLIIFYPIVNPNTEIFIWILIIGIIRLTSMIVAFKRYKTFAMLHTYGNKITGLVLFIFPLLIPYIQTVFLMRMLCIIAILSAFEELIIQMTAKQLKLDRKSIFTK